jgi:hypothetical protein
MKPEESAVAKSTGLQEKKDVSLQDAALFRVLSSKEKISKINANYDEGERTIQDVMLMVYRSIDPFETKELLCHKTKSSRRNS